MESYDNRCEDRWMMGVYFGIGKIIVMRIMIDYMSCS